MKFAVEFAWSDPGAPPYVIPVFRSRSEAERFVAGEVHRWQTGYCALRPMTGWVRYTIREIAV